MNRSTPRSSGLRTVWAMAALLLPLASQAAAGEEWEYTMSLQAQGMSMPMGTIKVCRAATLSSSLKPGLAENCKLEDYKRSGNTASFRAVCGPPQPSTLSGEMTRTGDTMKGSFRMQQGGQEMVMNQAARKLGACTNPVE